MLKVDEMAPVMDVRQEEKQVRAGLRRRYLRQGLAPIDTSLRAPRRDLTVVTTGQDLRRHEVEVEVEDDSDEEEAAGNAPQGTKNRQGKDTDSDDDDDDEYRQNQPVATLAVPEPETPSPTAQSFLPPQLVPSTSTTLPAPAIPTTPATPPTPTFPPLPPPPPPPAVITLPPTTVVMTSTIMTTPRPSAIAPPVVNNPQVDSPPPTMSKSIPMMTTQPITLVSSISVSSQPRKGVESPETTSSLSSSPTSTQTTQTTPFAFEKSTPSATPSLDEVRNGNDNGRDHDRGPPRGLDPGAEHALISAGSIGGFIIVCFFCWMAWRMVKKSKAREGGYYGNQPPPSNQLLAKIPYFGRGQRGWQEMGDGPNDLRNPSQYEKTNSMGQISEIYSMYDPRSQTQSMSKQGPLVLPQLQTNFSPAGNYINNPLSATSGSIHTSQSGSSPLRMQTASPQAQLSQQPLTNMPPQLQPGFSPASHINPFVSNTSADGSNSASPNNTLQYGSVQNTGTMLSVGTTHGMGTMQTVATTMTDRSRMQDPFFNQSELARQPSDAYDPNRRQVYRASELSSLSSGFGDEDIIVPPPAATRQPTAPGASRLSYQQTPSVSRKNSVANASEAGNSYRDTVYTTTSEDMPPRFRTVNSWVNQQTGRVRRAEQRTNEDIPPVPSMPAEERYTMMMDDEEPRRPDATAAPVPALPAEFKDTKP